MWFEDHDVKPLWLVATPEKAKGSLRVQLPDLISMASASGRQHPVILVEGKIRKKCEQREAEIFELKRKLAETRTKFEADKHELVGLRDDLVVDIDLIRSRLNRQQIETRRTVSSCSRTTEKKTRSGCLSHFLFLSGLYFIRRVIPICGSCLVDHRLLRDLLVRFRIRINLVLGWVSF